MQTLYIDNYIEIKKQEKQDFLEILQKQQINDNIVFYTLTEKILQTVKENRCSSLIFIVNNIKYYPDTNYFQETYVPALGEQGVKSLAVVVGNDEDAKAFHKELDNSLSMVKQRYGLQLRFFSDASDAKAWVTSLRA
jgi:hypothetical protein